MKLKSITVFCGSKSGNNPIYKEQSLALAKAMANKEISLVYGGSNVGIMGAIADAVLANGGKAIGVVPHFLTEIEVHHTALTELIFVDTMHERKLKMSQIGDGFIALPGGYGTLDELFEILTWAQLGLHDKPIGILNVNQFYTPLLEMIYHVEKEGFLYKGSTERLLSAETAEELIEKMERYTDAPQRIVLSPEKI